MPCLLVLVAVVSRAWPDWLPMSVAWRCSRYNWEKDTPLETWRSELVVIFLHVYTLYSWKGSQHQVDMPVGLYGMIYQESFEGENFRINWPRLCKKQTYSASTGIRPPPPHTHTLKSFVEKSFYQWPENFTTFLPQKIISNHACMQ